MFLRDVEMVEQERRKAAKSLGMFAGLLGSGCVLSLLMLSSSAPHPADIGIRFRDEAKAIYLRQNTALPRGLVLEELKHAYEDYSAGRPGVRVVDLPKQAAVATPK